MRLHSPIGPRLARWPSLVTWPGLAAGAAALVLAPPSPTRAQGPVVANRVEVSSGAASLHLEFAGGGQLAIGFSDGVVTANGAVLGRYEPHGAADRAWRALLETAMPLSAGPLARALDRWRPDTGLPEADREVLAEVDQVLEAALAGSTGSRAPNPDPADGEARFDELTEDRVRALLRVVLRHGHIPGLGLDDVDVESLEFALGEDRLVPHGASVNGSILVADGDLDVRGRIRGHAIVVDGTVLLEEGGRVDGDVRLVDADIEHRGGSLRGRVVHVLEEVRRERLHDRAGGRQWGATYRVARAAQGVLEAAVCFLVLACLALLSVRLAGDRVDAVAQAVKDNPGRSAAVGLAGSFLVLPAYVLGIVVLAVTIVGIPVLLAWVPLFPVVVAAAAAVGYVATSSHVGRWMLDQNISKLERFDRHNPTHVKLVGIAALTAPFAVGAVVRAVPWVGWLGNVVHTVGTLGGIAAVVVGLGAVILTRGGRRALDEYAFADALDAEQWSAEIDDADLDDTTSPTPGSGS